MTAPAPNRFEVFTLLQKAYEKQIGQEILINYATVWVADSHTEERAFDPPLRATISPGTRPEDVMNDFDPREGTLTYWDVNVLEAHGQLKENENVWSIYGFGWTPEDGVETEPCSEWEFAPPPLSYPFH